MTSVLLCLCGLSAAANVGAVDGEETSARVVSFAGPDFKEVLSLESTGDPKISPDGSTVE